MKLTLRPAVALCERTTALGQVRYLSLYDDEIEERADRFWSSLNRAPGEFDCADLELTDAVVWEKADGTVLVARGGSATFPLYWSVAGGCLELSTRLPLQAGVILSRSGLAASIAGACLHGSYEPNGFIATPLAGWQRVRRASIVRFESDRLMEERVSRVGPGPARESRHEVVTAVREAFDAYARSQAKVRNSVVELSGGFDSTLAAAIPTRDGMSGVSVTFPYYEFRFEEALQRSAAHFLSVRRTVLAGVDLFPYSPPEQPARFDEPSVYMTGIRHAEQVARFACARGAERLYNGHGGDQLFATDLLDGEKLVGDPPGRGPFSRTAWRAISGAIEAVRSSQWLDRSLGTFVYDARPDVWMRETIGPVPRTPFSDLDVFRSALAWSKWCRRHDVRPDKTILAEALGDRLPEAIVNRRGKVAYDGVWMRAYRQHADHIAEVFEAVSESLIRLGISPQWLLRRVRDLGEWREVSDREVLAVYAIGTWLLAWGLQDPSVVDWAD